MEPRRPTNIPAYAEVCLQALVAAGLNDKISLGGAFGLLHYLDYRPTHDVDAWWNVATTSQEREAVMRAIETALQPFGVCNIEPGEMSSVWSYWGKKTKRSLAFKLPNDPPNCNLRFRPTGLM